MVYSVMGPRQKIAFPLLILHVLLFCIHGDHATSTNDYIGSRCNVTANYTQGSKFELNMHTVFNTLTKDAPPSGFTNTTKGQGSNRVYGLVQCRGDVDQGTCKACIHNSTVAVVATYCPNAADAIIWYEKCQLRYSNTNFFAHLNVEDSGSWYWTNDKVEDPKAFNEKLGGLLKNLTSKATAEPSKFMFATGYIPYTNLQTIYGLVQCTGDTSLADCNLCLGSTMSQIPSTCENAHGCEIATGSCRVRYDTELFYGTSKIPSASPPSSSPAPSNSRPSPSPLFHSSSPAPNSSPPSNGAPKTTSDKSNDSSATTVAIITVITFALTSTWLLMMPSWL